jgi:hypothetical protein
MKTWPSMKSRSRSDESSSFCLAYLPDWPPFPAEDGLGEAASSNAGGGCTKVASERQQFSVSGRMNMLRKVTQFASIALAIFVFALPVSACLLSTADMTVKQRHCCRKMAGHCEASLKLSSHSCCQPPASQQAAIASKTHKNDFGPTVAAPMGVASPLPRIISQSSIATFESPPGSSTQIIAILRI